MTRASRMRRDDKGYVLLLALGFITFVGVIAVALVSYTTTNLRATITLRDIRGEQFAADGAVDGAINAVRITPTLATTPAAQHLCFNATLNSQPIRVDCVGPLANVTFTACLGGGGPCTASSAILVAEATINGGPITINSWSMRR